MDINIIINEIESMDIFDLNTYYDLIKKYGKNACREAFDLFLKRSSNKEDTFRKFFDAYFSFEIDEMEINEDSYLILAKKYGEDIINNYFKRLASLNDSNYVLIKFADIYQYVNIDTNIENSEISDFNDSFYSIDAVSMYINQMKNFPMLSVCEERKKFNTLTVDKKKIKIASIDDFGVLSFYNFCNVLCSISSIEHIKLLNKIKEYLDDKEKLVVSNYIKLWKKLNKDKKEENILPNIKDLGLTFSKINILDSNYLTEQLGYILDYNKTRELIINSNLRLVFYNAKRFFNKTVDFTPLDLIQSGNIGLIRAIEKFDVNRGYKFSTYATWWINQSITRDLADNSRNIRIPVNLQEKIRRIDKTGLIDNEQIPNTWNDGQVEYLRGLVHGNAFISLNTPIGEDSDITLQDAIPDLKNVPEEEVFSMELKKQINDILNSLTERERTIIMLRFGFNCKSLTLDVIGKKLGITRERVRQIEDKALRKLRHPVRGKNLVDFCENPNYYGNE